MTNDDKQKTNFQRLNQALIFAARAHDGQQRKGTDIPYIIHPVMLAMRLLTMDCAENVVIAALLHDTVEDTAITLEDISREFGAEVAEVVAAASEPEHSTARWETRKQHTIDFLRDAPLPVKLLACADKLHNIQSMQSDFARQGERVWERFARGREKQAWYYRRLAKNLPAGVALPEMHPIFAEFAEAVDNLFGK